MSDYLKRHMPKLLTTALVVVALFAAYLLYARYTARPWTRDGQVRANVIKVAPRVEGYIIEVAIKDNEFVRKGELLFQIDKSDYQLAVDKAKVQIDQAREDVAALEAAVRAAEAMVRQSAAAVTSAEGQIAEAQAGIQSAEAAVQEASAGVASAKATIDQYQAQLEEARREARRAKRLADLRAGSVETAEARAAAVEAGEAQLAGVQADLKQAEASLAKANAGQAEATAQLTIALNGLAEAQAALETSQADRDQAMANLGEAGDANVRVRDAKVQLEEAKLKLAWTTITAPTDGYISNLYVSEGTFAVVASPLVAFVDSQSFRVHAFFQETKLRHIQPGDPAVVTLMGHHDLPIEAEVVSIGQATNPPDVAPTEGEIGVVPQIEPTFDWVRLAQRVPVHVRLVNIPEGVNLVSGMTASVAIRPQGE